MTVHVPAQWLPEPELLDSLDTAALAVGTDGTVRHANLVGHHGVRRSGQHAGRSAADRALRRGRP